MSRTKLQDLNMTNTVCSSYSMTNSGQKFTENRGQWDSRAKFLARTGPVDMWVTSTGIVYNWHGPIEEAPVTPKDQPPARLKMSSYAVDVEFVGATGLGKAVGLHPLAGNTNYYLGKRKATHVRDFASATIQDLYKGIDLVTYFDENEKRPRYDLVVHPGADPNQIRMRFDNAKNLTVTKEGSVCYDTPYGKVEEMRQMAYQKADNGPDFHFFPAQIKNRDGTIGFDTTGYQKDRTLVIDPLVWSTYLGGGGVTRRFAQHVDSNHNLYITGITSDPSFPGQLSSSQVPFKTFVAKFDATGACLYTTFYDDGDSDSIDIGFDNVGNAFIVGEAFSGGLNVIPGSTFPVGAAPTGFLAKFDLSGALIFGEYINSAITATYNLSAFAVSPNGDCSIGGLIVLVDNIFLETLKVGANGAILSRFLDIDHTPKAITGVALDPAGNAFFGTISSDGGTCPGGFQPQNGWTAVSGAGPDSGISNALILKFDPQLNLVLSSTFLGGVGNISKSSIAVDAAGNVFVYSTVQGSRLSLPLYPTTPGAIQIGTAGQTPRISQTAAISKLSNDLSTLEASGYFGAADGEFSQNLVTDSAGCPVFVGVSAGTLGIPLTWDYFSGHVSTQHIVRLSADLSTELYATYFGGATTAISAFDVDSDGNLYVGGTVQGEEIPTTPGALEPNYLGGTVGFVSVIDPKMTPGLQRIATDRGATPNLAGGVGKHVSVNVYFAEPDGTNITLSSPDPTVQVNGSSSATFVASGQIHVAAFTVTANDVTHVTPVTLTASDGTNTLPIVVTVQPFVRTLVVRPIRGIAGTGLTAFIYPYETPATDQHVQIMSNPANGLVASAPVTIPGDPTLSLPSPITTSLTVGPIFTTQVGTISATHLEGVSTAATSFTFTGPSLTSAVFTGNTLNITLSSPVVNQSYTFTSGNPSISPDVTVNIANGASGSAVAVPVEDFSTASSVRVNYTATVNGVKKIVPLVLIPNGITGLSITQSSVVEGDPLNFSGALMRAMSMNETFNLTTNYPTTLAPFQLNGAVGQSAIGGTVSTLNAALTAPRTLTLSMQWAGPTGPSGPIKSASVTVLPLLTSITLGATSVKGGSDVTGSINLVEPNNTAHSTIGISSNSANAFFDSPSITPGSLTTIPFTVHTKTVTKNTTVVITLASPLGYKSKVFNLVLTP